MPDNIYGNPCDIEIIATDLANEFEREIFTVEIINTPPYVDSSATTL